jgi:hypothetical protein
MKAALEMQREFTNSPAMKSLADARTQIAFGSAADVLRRLQGPIVTSPTMASLSRQIVEQQRALDSISTSTVDAFHPADRIAKPHIPEITIPPNPALQTNKLLKEIQSRFDKMEAIAVESAKIATGLQASAVDFLQKFEAAANDNSQAAKRAIRMGVFAIAIALLTPITQMAHTELWRAPSDAATTQQIITSLRADISDLKVAHTSASERLSAVAENSSNELARALREIRDMLATQSAKPIPQSSSKAQQK